MRRPRSGVAARKDARPIPTAGQIRKTSRSGLVSRLARAGRVLVIGFNRKGRRREGEKISLGVAAHGPRGLSCAPGFEAFFTTLVASARRRVSLRSRYCREVKTHLSTTTRFDLISVATRKDARPVPRHVRHANAEPGASERARGAPVAGKTRQSLLSFPPSLLPVKINNPEAKPCEPCCRTGGSSARDSSLLCSTAQPKL